MCFYSSMDIDLSGLSVHGIAVGGAYDNVFLQTLTVDVPEPSGLALLGIALFGFGMLNKRKKLN